MIDTSCWTIQTMYTKVITMQARNLMNHANLVCAFSFLNLRGYKEWQEQPHMFIINNKRMKEIEVAYDILKEIIEDYSPDAKFDFKINQFNNGNVTIEIETDELVVKNISNFISVIQLASNFEVYPLTNGNIKFSIMFHDVMEVIK